MPVWESGGSYLILIRASPDAQNWRRILISMMRSTSLFGLILVFALVAAGCSGDDETSQVASLETGTADTSQDAEATEADRVADDEAAILAFTQCLRDQGIEIDDPTVDADGNLQLPPIGLTSESDGTDPEEAIAAFADILASCEEHLEGITPTLSGHDTTEFEDAVLEYAQCMRSHGIDMPDPDFSPDGGIIDLGSGDGEAFEAADAECRPLLARLGLGG
jgi:hypothetical protein